MTTAKCSASVFALILATVIPCFGGQTSSSEGFAAWVESPDMRLTPASFSRDLSTTAKGEAFRNEVVSMQFALRSSQELASFSAGCEAASGTEASSLPCSWEEIRYPGYVLVDEIGQYTTDPLFEKPPGRIEANRTQAIWLTIRIPRSAAAGDYANALVVRAGDQEAHFDVRLRVLDFTLPDLPEGSFYLNIWQYPADVARWAKVPLWSEAHWKLLEAYARDLAEHGQKSITTSILYDPWRSQTGSVFPSMVEWRFPGEWRLGEESKFQFDYTAFDRYVELMMKAGVNKTIHCFSMVNGPGHSPDCDIGYLDTQTGHLRIRHTEVGDEWYKHAWGVFLPAFVAHLKEKGWLDRTYIGFDEKPQSIMQGILAELHAAAPGLKIALAGGSSSQEATDAGDLTIYWDDLAHPDAVARLLAKRRGVGPTTFYTACAPHSPNTFDYSPLWESRILPWYAFRYNLDGYLRWAYNAWPESLWTQPRYRWHSGDNFFVYPGDNGPTGSVRWEMLRQGIEDFEVLHMLRTRISTLEKEPARAAEAVHLKRALKDVVAMGCELDDCEDWPHPDEARLKVDRLYAEAMGKPMKETSPYTSASETVSKFSPEDFVPDANLDKPAWRNATWVKFDRNAFTEEPYPQSETEVASIWTASHVYFAFRCKYTTLNIYEGEDIAKERWELWNRDVVEVFLNPTPERYKHYYEFEVSPNNMWIDLVIDLDKTPFNDAGWDSDFDHATRVDAKNHVWTCMMRIPVRTMDGPRVIQPGMEWRVNYYRADGPGSDAQRRFLSWSPILGEKHSFHTPTRFGLIKFVK